MQQYTIYADTTLTYIFDAFVTSPAGCTITYSHSVTPALTELTFTSTSRQFDFSSTDLTLALATTPFYQDYVVTITAQSSTVTTSDTFSLRIIHPC